ncbi:MAG: hypothetical protein AAGG01_02495 [Planctomycetota bacterium]
MLLTTALLVAFQTQSLHVSPSEEPDRTNVRVNVFTGSSQDNVSIAELADQHLVTVWHSRRQEEGTYGIRARRLSPSGEPVTDEVQVNETTEGMQVEPSLSVEPGAGSGVWFAWVSRGQDGSGDGVWARRFSPELDRASAEVRVAERTAGDQSEPTVVALCDGGAFCIWTGPGEVAGSEVATSRRAVYGRFLDEGGKPAGARVTLASSSEASYRTPTAARFRDGILLAVAVSDAVGRPQGILMRFMSEAGELSKEAFVDGSEGLPVEPTLSAGENRAAVAWLVADPAAGGEYTVRWRNVNIDGEADLRWTLGPLRRAEGTGQTGYTSGLSAAIHGDLTALTWARYVESTTPELIGLVVEEVAAEEEPRTLFGPAAIADVKDGSQALTVGGASPRTCFLSDGRLAAAWHGNGELGDTSGAHITLLDAPGQTSRSRIVARSGINRSATEMLPLLLKQSRPRAIHSEKGRLTGQPTVAQTGLGIGPLAPGPHDLPTFSEKDVDDTPTYPTQRSAGPGGGLDFLGFTSTGWTPPDPEMAVGMNHIVAIVNGGIRFFDKLGTQLFDDQIEGSGGFWGAQGATGFVFDPEVVWDPHTDRFVAIAAERNSGQSYFLLAVSDDDDPNGNWFKYRLDVTPLIGANIDSVNLSVDDSAIYLTGDWFSPTRYFVYIIDKASVLNGGTPVTTNTTITGRHSMGAPVNYDAGASAGYFLFAPESASSTSVILYGITDPLGSPQVQTVSIPVPEYRQPADPPQMGTSNRPELFEARFWNAVLRNGRLWATHHQGSPAKQRWYEFDLAGWPQSGQQPTLVQSGEVDGGTGVSTYFGSLWVNDAGDMSLTCAMSSSSTFISMVRAFRAAGDPLGSTTSVETVIESTSPETSGRWGDYSATNDDPSSPGIFWGHHEYRTSGWRTRIASFDPCSGGATPYCVSSPNSVGAGAVISAAGSTSVSENSLTLSCVGMAPGAFGVYFYGDAQTSTPAGDGVLCASGNLFRVAVTQADFIGRSFLNLDLTMPPVPAAEITAGSTWNFQHFYRDIQPGGSGLNFSNAVEIRFCP